MSDPTPTHPGSASRASRVPVIAEFHEGVMTWGRLRAIVAIAANDDDEKIRFEAQPGTYPLDLIMGIYVEIDTP